MTATDSRTSVVIATRNRRAELLRTLDELRALRPRPPIIVVDNASGDGTPEAVAEQHPQVSLIRSPRNLGAPARNIGCLAASTPYIAFCDDDSWWNTAALPLAEEVFTEHPEVGLIAAHTLVGEQQRPDPVNELMAHSPLETPAHLPGPRVLGFTACSAIVRREAFRQVHGFNPVLFFVAEEKLLAYDLAASGWELIHLSDAIAHHHPSGERTGHDRRRAVEQRNNLLISWMRRSPGTVARHTGRLVRDSLRAPTSRRALLSALPRLPAALLRRRRLPARVERDVDVLENTAGPVRTHG